MYRFSDYTYCIFSHCFILEFIYSNGGRIFLLPFIFDFSEFSCRFPNVMI